MSPAPGRALLSRLKQEQSGFALIETLVSAIIVVLVAVGTLQTMDRANGSSGQQKSKSVAAALAQQDQERLRAFRAKELSNHFETRTETVPAGTGVKYRIISRTDWVTDQSGTRACGTGARADYQRISSTVVWTDPGNEEVGPQRVSLASIVAPRAGSFGEEGSLSIEVLDRDAVGHEGVPVAVTGPKTLNGATDANGCLFFGYLPEGNYTVSVSQPGLIDANGNAQISQQFGVQDGSTTSAVIELDQAASLNVTFSTRKGAQTIPSKADHVSIGHSGLDSPGWRSYGNTTTPTPQPSYAIDTLFPFSSGYSVYSGNCPGANPSPYDVPYLVTEQNWPSSRRYATLDPGASGSVVVHEPAVRINPSGSGTTAEWPGNSVPGTPLTGADMALVALTPKPTWLGSPTYCSETLLFWTFKDSLSGTGAWLVNASDPDWWTGNGANADFGVPVGAYSMCVVYPFWVADSAKRYRSVSTPTALNPLTRGPNLSNAAVTVSKPVSTTPCWP